MSDYYARKIAELRGQQQPAPAPVGQPSYPPVSLPGQLPAHLAPYAQPPAPQTPQAFVGAQPGQVPQHFFSYDANTGAQVEDDGTVALLYNSAAQTGGSKLVRENTSKCPNCGGTMFARAHSENGMPLRVPAMPQCGDCNYPVVQAGSTGGALASAKGGQGPAQAARQLPRNHRVTVLDGSTSMTYEPPGGR